MTPIPIPADERREAIAARASELATDPLACLFEDPDDGVCDEISLIVHKAVVDALEEQADAILASEPAREDDDRREDLKSAFVAGCCAVLTWTNSGMPQDDLDEAGYDYADHAMAAPPSPGDPK